MIFCFKLVGVQVFLPRLKFHELLSRGNTLNDPEQDHRRGFFAIKNTSHSAYLSGHKKPSQTKICI